MKNASQSIRVKLNLHFEDLALTGTMQVDRGECRPFHGWLELIAAIERLRPPDGTSTGPREPSDR